MADGHPPFNVSLVTPEGAAYEGEAVMLIVPGAAGEIGVLARHAPLIATLKSGSTRVHLQGGQVEEDRAIALVDDAQQARDIDVHVAQRRLEEAKAELERVEKGESPADRWVLEQRVRHAENLLEVAGRPA